MCSLSTPSSTPSPCLDSQNTRRATLLDRIHQRYPRYQPLNDSFEIFMLGISNDTVPEGELRTWLDKKFAHQLAWKGTPEGVFEDARIFLDLSGGISGVKPRPGTRNVYMRAIPDSDYSLRLFPGNIALQEYCADFVRTSTGKAVDCIRTSGNCLFA
ncbi:hypothetical protein LXA43DRAFT_878744 [Ganoderma leucocontextum]|nr:hypothetical protein LXA43DRAFT_878744 [Ganoderma leucocontextum]